MKNANDKYEIIVRNLLYRWWQDHDQVQNVVRIRIQMC